jgi:citrate lyase synthetase
MHSSTVGHPSTKRRKLFEKQSQKPDNFNQKSIGVNTMIVNHRPFTNGIRYLRNSKLRKRVVT